MKLIDLLSIINDNTNVLIHNADCEVLAEYDGRNSIDSEFNDREVVEIFTYTHGRTAYLAVEIKEGN